MPCFALSSLAVSMVAERLLGWPFTAIPLLLALGTAAVSVAMLSTVGVGMV